MMEATQGHASVESTPCCFLELQAKASALELGSGPLWSPTQLRSFTAHASNEPCGHPTPADNRTMTPSLSIPSLSIEFDTDTASESECCQWTPLAASIANTPVTDEYAPRWDFEEHFTHEASPGKRIANLRLQMVDQSFDGQTADHELLVELLDSLYRRSIELDIRAVT
mmetsp:Transcript_21273/g.49983  ORF Transcript_21273/g.49983 Transcript_21273/m.49983 type:complete len:169 (+) Transcript_21273:49-555(+)|eukprot:CAMPEP_0114541886 /NCGR_PEP_ID=MMETSP0114-20121206/1544_1 /TAXON_ID=31324 /ORGANISM="Goniomonas sp, Strain m" /LENGTH=168 /DNA_ID=CAMNT_0001726153 /DNA_START=24 /DNA_END=530 /DNA_ORIENTATION=+